MARLRCGWIKSAASAIVVRSFFLQAHKLKWKRFRSSASTCMPITRMQRGADIMPTIDANPFPYEFDIDHIALICIDMQRDFCLPGGFTQSLGNEIKNIAPCIPVIAELQTAFRKAGLPIIHTKECHKPDLSDLPTAKRHRGNPKTKIGDAGPTGRILIDGEEGSDFIPENAPRRTLRRRRRCAHAGRWAAAESREHSGRARARFWSPRRSRSCPNQAAAPVRRT